MKTLNYTITVFALSLMMLACQSTKNYSIYTIASQTTIGYGVAPQTCFLVKENNDTTWSLFYSDIEGFNYEPGYEYVIEVEKKHIENPPADGSSIRYKLIKTISKESKESENLPETNQEIIFEY